MMRFKIATNSVFSIHPMGEFAYSFDCTFFRLICLTAKTLRTIARMQSVENVWNKFSRTTMCGFLVGATEPDKSAGQPICTVASRPEGVRYREVPHVKRTLKRVQLRILG